jgi:hypothetical protein
MSKDMSSTDLLVDIFDQFVQIFKPEISILILEITTHCHHYMICSITTRLKIMVHLRVFSENNDENEKFKQIITIFKLY